MYACEFGCGYLSSSYNQVVQHEQECHAAAPGVSQQRPFVEYIGTTRQDSRALLERAFRVLKAITVACAWAVLCNAPCMHTVSQRQRLVRSLAEASRRLLSYGLPPHAPGSEPRVALWLLRLCFVVGCRGATSRPDCAWSCPCQHAPAPCPGGYAQARLTSRKAKSAGRPGRASSKRDQRPEGR